MLEWVDWKALVLCVAFIGSIGGLLKEIADKKKWQVLASVLGALITFGAEIILHFDETRRANAFRAKWNESQAVLDVRQMIADYCDKTKALEPMRYHDKEVVIRGA